MWVGGGKAARINEFSYTKDMESEFFFYKESESNKKKILAIGRGGSVIFFLFSKESKSEKKNVSFLRG